MGEVTACQLCGSDELNLILDMGKQPLAENFDDGRLWPLGLLRCRDCGLVQLSYVVDPALVFPRGHPYASGNSTALRYHFAELADVVTRLLGSQNLIVDIGANDGTFLSQVPARFTRLAVEPTDQVRKAAAKGLLTVQEFWDGDVAAGILAEHGPARVITASNVLAHTPDPHGFVEGVMDLLADDGVFITENGCLDAITDGLQFDSVYHEHLRYYSVASMSRLLDMHGMQVLSAQRLPLHGGIYRITATKRSGGADFGTYIYRAAAQIRSECRQISEAGGTIYGIGAATRASTMIHFAKIAQYIDRVCEMPDSEKIGRMMPGTSIPVVAESELFAAQPSHAFVFAWQIADSLIPKLGRAGYAGKFIVPLPEPRII